MQHNTAYGLLTKPSRLGVAVKRSVLALIIAGLLIGDPLTLRSANNLWAENTIRFVLQVSAYSTLEGAQKEIEHLKSFKITAHYTTKEDRNQKKWFAVYIDHYGTKEEATRSGNQLVQKGFIQNFFIFPMEVKSEPPSKTKEIPAPPETPSRKEPKPKPGKSPGFSGPIVIKEEENALRIYIFVDRKFLPKISVDKNAEGSRLIAVFKNVKKSLIPIEFHQAKSKPLLSFDVSSQGPDCIFSLRLSSDYNYDVSQNYFEKEKIYSLKIGREPTVNPNPETKE